jgi:glyoxylase-like metal-dependent hydrolase (beta-lactamase superfamily II)/rhodanese-related sulfurtransferase
MEVVTIDTPQLGDRSYLAHDGAVAVAVDPQRDIDRVLRAAGAAGVEVVAVAETHLHNDYVSGGRQLAATTGATHLMAGGGEVAFSCMAVGGGEEHHFGGLRVVAVATPGHTAHHVAYVVDHGEGPAVAFTGGSLLFGTVGRTDLVGEDQTQSLTRRQYHSVRQLVASLADDVIVCPTHGFGSFCSSTPPSGDQSSTIGDEREHNLVFRAGDETSFVKMVLSGLTAYPSYYAHMGPINRAGPAPIDLSPPRQIDGPELARHLEAGDWVVDLRNRRAFAVGHLPRTVNAEMATSLSTFLGWVVPWGTPVVLMSDDPAEVRAAQRDLARVGIDRPAGVAVGDPRRLAAGETETYAVGDFADLRLAMADHQGEGALTVLDVRRDDEWEQGHLEGAVHIHFSDLEARMAEVPPGRVWVYCATGYRSAIAASLLARAGREPVLVDDDWERAEQAGLPVCR